MSNCCVGYYPIPTYLPPPVHRLYSLAIVSMSRVVTPFTVGFAVALIPAAWIFFASYRSPDERLKDLQKSGYTSTARLPPANTAANQQLLASIFSNRKEPDLYTALGETNRKAPAAVAAEMGVVPAQGEGSADPATASPHPSLSPLKSPLPSAPSARSAASHS
jgi:hypothetical protein